MNRQIEINIYCRGKKNAGTDEDTEFAVDGVRCGGERDEGADGS